MINEFVKILGYIKRKMISVLQGTCLAGIPFLSVVVVMLCFWTVGPTLDGPKIDVDV